MAGIYDTKTQTDVVSMLEENEVDYGSVWIGGKLEDTLDLTGDPQGLWRWLSGEYCSLNCYVLEQKEYLMNRRLPIL